MIIHRYLQREMNRVENGIHGVIFFLLVRELEGTKVAAALMAQQCFMQHLCGYDRAKR